MTSNDAWTTTFESFGVRLGVAADTREVRERIPATLPPGAKPCPSFAVEESFGVLADDGGSYRLERGKTPVANRLDLELALTLLDDQLRKYIGLHAPNRIFVHAGVVAHEGSAIVIPGLSLAGKTTLVLELVRAGAVYYSDAFAVLDEHGLVHAYPASPVVREPARPSPVGIEHLETRQASGPLTIGTVVLTTYRPGAQWRPERVSPGRGVLAMLAHAPAALTRSEEAMRVIAGAIERALILEGDRGEAADLAPRLLNPVPAHSLRQ